MRSLSASTAFLALAISASSLLTGCAEEISRDQLVQKVGQPPDFAFFGNKALYMGDEGGYRYVHVRDICGCLNFVGECDFKVPESQWPMNDPMPLTDDAAKWRNVEWMNGDAPEGVPQSTFLCMTPVFPLGVPATMPAAVPPPPASGPSLTPSTSP